jgi:hypothetical protein
MAIVLVDVHPRANELNAYEKAYKKCELIAHFYKNDSRKMVCKAGELKRKIEKMHENALYPSIETD